MKTVDELVELFSACGEVVFTDEKHVELIVKGPDGLYYPISGFHKYKGARDGLEEMGGLPYEEGYDE